MNKQNTILLLLSGVIIVLVLMFNNEPPKSSFEKSALFPDLIQHVTDVQNIEIKDHNGVLLQAEKSGETWLDTQFDGYPIDASHIVQLLNDLAQANLDEAKTKKPENFARLGLQDIQQQDSEAVLIALSTDERSWQLLVGKSATGGAGTYMRIPETLESWLSKTMLELPESRSDWLRDDILDVDSATIQAIRRIDAEKWQIQRYTANVETDNKSVDDENVGDSSKWALANMPDDRSLKYDGILEGFVEDFVGLSFSDLQQEEPADKQLLAEFELVQESGNSIAASLFRANEQYYINFSTAEGNPYWTKWYYQLTSYAGGQLLKSTEDFLLEQEEDLQQQDVQAEN